MGWVGFYLFLKKINRSQEKVERKGATVRFVSRLCENY
jgi:hypothetical protein